MPPQEEVLRNLVQMAFKILNTKYQYKQKTVVQKLEVVGCKVSTPLFSNIISGERAATGTLMKVAKAIQKIVLDELGEQWDAENHVFVSVRTADWKPQIVEISEDIAFGKSAPGIEVHHLGRLSIQEKTQFIAGAKNEVLEMGLRLRTFADYFFSRNENEYKIHIINLLRRGVNVRVYMLDPKSEEATVYFKDRAKVLTSEANYALPDSERVVSRLASISGDFQRMKLPGKFEAYIYRHIPVAHFLVVDSDSDSGKMLFSPYLFGLPRAECPIFEIYKRQQKQLFLKHLKSLSAMLKGAQLIQPA